MRIKRRSIFSKPFVPEKLQVQRFQRFKHGCSHQIDLKKSGSTGNATGAPTKT